MDLVSKSHSIRASRALLSTITSPRAAASAPLLRTSTLHHANDNTSFPIIAIAIIGILATAFLLVGYYVFVIRCCLNWHRIDLLRRFSLSAANRAGEELLMAAYSPGQPQSRGLDESTIRSIPVFRFGKDGTSAGMFAAAATTNDVKFSECAVCLNEFEEGEKLRIIPNCLHIFHIDCIDVWLQSNANCPLCRTSISANRFQFDPAVVAPSPSPIDPDDEDYVVIELSNHDNNIVNNNNNEADQIAQRAAAAEEASPRKMENSKKKRRFFSKGNSMGDECIDTRGGEKDEEFAVAQPIRRSFSMDSSADRKMFLAIQEAVRHCREVSGSEVISIVGPIEGCSSSSPSDNNNNNINNRVKRSFFSFGQGRGGSRSAVLPVYLEP